MKRLVIIVIIFSLLTACSSKPTIKVDYDPDTNFKLLSSYQYDQQNDTSFDANPIMIHRIQTAIDSNLAANNFTKYDFVDKKSADLTIKVSFTQQEKQNNSSFSIGLGKSTMGGHSGASIGLSTSVPINGTADIITTIIIDIRDKNQAIWHGSDVYETAEDSTIEQTNQAVNATVDRLLAHFPPEKQ